MSQFEEVIFETFVGRSRTPLRMTLGQYHAWLENIRRDEKLMAGIKAVLSGSEPMQDLDEGDAGIFAGRVFPYAEAVGAKLDEPDAGLRHVFLAALLNRILADLSPSRD